MTDEACCSGTQFAESIAIIDNSYGGARNYFWMPGANS
jgi:hypothetical protein